MLLTLQPCPTSHPLWSQPHCPPGQCFDPDTGELTEYGALSWSTNIALWQVANTAEIHWLAHGTLDTPRTNTMFFILVSTIPHGTQATYLHIMCAHQPKKSIPHWVCWTVGGDHVQYDGNVSTKTTDITTAKLLFNSVVLTPGAQCMIGDLKNFYLGTPMTANDYVHMCIPMTIHPQVIIDHYNLTPLIYKGHVYVEIRWGMYSLPQASKLANAQLKHFLALHGYHPCPFTPRLWMHDT